jgi:hypothetical protein
MRAKVNVMYIQVFKNIIFNDKNKSSQKLKKKKNVRSH